MATEVTTRLRDDIDGSVADRTVSFSWEGGQYEIDLSKKNAADLEALLAPYVAAGRRAGSKGVAPRGRKATAKPAKATTRTPAAAKPATDLAAVRSWASANGHSVAARGRISATVLEAFNARGTAASAPSADAAAPAKRASKRAAKPAAKATPRKRAAKPAAKRVGRPARAAAAPVVEAPSA
jgi:hypothetical protein